MTINFTTRWMPKTAMASAYLRALIRAVSTRHPATKVVLPTGIAEVSELARVLQALNLIPNKISKGEPR